MPVSYPLPSWLQASPTDVANKFVSGLQIGAQLGEARNRLAHQAQQSSIENQVTQEKLAASAMQQAQELQVKKAYEDQQVQLAQQKIAAAQQKVGLETAKAARQFQAQQAYQRDYQAGLDMELEPEEAARASYFKNLVQFGSPAGVASAMRPSKSSMAQIPETMVTPSGTELAYNKATGHFAVTNRPQDKSANVYNKMDYAALQRELGMLQKAQADPMAQIDKAGTAQRTTRMQQINQQLQRIKAGQTSAPAAMPTGDDWEGDYGPTTTPAPTSGKTTGFKVVGVTTPAAAAPAPTAAAPAPTTETAATIPGLGGLKVKTQKAGTGRPVNQRLQQQAKVETNSRAKELYSALRNANTGKGTFMSTEEWNTRWTELNQLLTSLTPEERKAITGE